MGWHFSLTDANLVSYLTTPKPLAPPRTTGRQMQNFLSALSHPRPPGILSSSAEWIGLIEKFSRHASARFESLMTNRHAEDFLVAKESSSLLHELRSVFMRFDLFVLVCASRERDRALFDFAEQSIRTYPRLGARLDSLFLMPNETFLYSGETIKLFDPFPSIHRAIEEQENWPGLLLWMKSGASAFVPVQDSIALYHDLLHIQPEAASQVLRKYRSKKRRGTRILHLSDLHFGTEEAAKNEGLVKAHIRSLAPKVDRVVITGDLCQNPDMTEARAFHNFRADLFAVTKKPVIVVPGNHDQRWMGWTAKDLGHLSRLEWSNLVVDYQKQLVFFCFDSSRDSRLAQGQITVDQMREVATEFRTHCATDPRVAKFLSIALIHHHPYQLDLQSEDQVDKTWWEALLQATGVSPEPLMAMRDAPQFLGWCARMRIPLILHGHKHIQRHVEQAFPPSATSLREFRITAAGCGTTLGAEGKPLTYNLVSWNPTKRIWTVSFFADPGDGSGFTQKFVTLHRF